MSQETISANRPASDRLEGLDLARSLAILGMILVHFLMEMIKSFWTSPVSLGLLDGRAATLFMFLAGIGIALYAKSQAKNPGFQLSLIKRGLFLLAIGYLNMIYWPGDILRVYGVTFLLMTLLHGRKSWVLYTTSALFILGFLVLITIIDYNTNWTWWTLTYRNAWTPQGLTLNLFYNGFRSVFPWTGILLLGVAVGRLPLSRPKYQWSGLALGAILVFIAEGTSYWIKPMVLALPEYASDAAARDEMQYLLGTSSMPPLPLFIISSLGTAFVVLSLCLIIARKAPQFWLVRALVATGQLAFSWYLAHVYLGVFIVAGLKLTTTKEWVALSSGFAYFALIVVISIAVRTRGRRGPLETLLRKLTSVKPQSA